MRSLSACVAGGLLAIPAAVLGYADPPPGKSGPPVVPYLCDGGRQIAAVYESGSDFRNATAKLTYEGRTIEMVAAPTLYGVRYRAEAAEGHALAWTLRGEEAWLTESAGPDSYAGEEPAIARCVRLRGPMPYAAADDGSHGEDH